MRSAGSGITPALVAAYAFGAVLDHPADLPLVQLALVLDLPAEDLAWCTQPAPAARPASLLALERAPADWSWRPAGLPVANHLIHRPLRIWTHIGSVVQVTVPLATLAGAAEQPGDLAGVGPIPPTMARQAAADGLWRWLATTDQGSVTDAAGRSYRPSAALADLIRGRDNTCRFPGCRQPAYRCDIDHTVPYPTGPTSAANLATLCRHHHRLKHTGGWTVRQHRDGRLTWTSPTGRTYTTTPPAHPPPESPPADPAT